MELEFESTSVCIDWKLCLLYYTYHNAYTTITITVNH